MTGEAYDSGRMFGSDIMRAARATGYAPVVDQKDGSPEPWICYVKDWLGLWHKDPWLIQARRFECLRCSVIQEDLIRYMLRITPQVGVRQRAAPESDEKRSEEETKSNAW